MNMRKRIKLLDWTGDTVSFENAVNDACKEIESMRGNILGIKIFDHPADKTMSCAIVYSL